MGSSKKHKKHKSEKREKYEEYSSMDHHQSRNGLKLILKVGSNSTPEYTNSDSPLAYNANANALNYCAGPSGLQRQTNQQINADYFTGNHSNADCETTVNEKHKKSKKKKKKKDREKKHKHHKEKRHRSGDRHSNPSHHHHDHQTYGHLPSMQNHQQMSNISGGAMDADSSQDEFAFMEENSQPLQENILYYAGITTANSPSCRPVTKPIVSRKFEEDLSSPTPSLQSANGSPTKPLNEAMQIIIPSPTQSTSASTPGGTGNATPLTPRTLEGPKTPSSSSESGREPRTCVLKLKQQKSPLTKLLDHLLRSLEKRDPHQFFAWPVTDDIAPGYSSIITKPMDFSTMRQKIDDNEYSTLTEFSDDFKLMCENAIRYNHVDTVYHKAAKRLLQVGSKLLTPESLIRSLKPLSGYMRELTAKELGFELVQGDISDQHMNDSADEGASTGAEEVASTQLEEEEEKRRIRDENEPKTRFEPYVDDLTSEEILAQVQGASRVAKKRLSEKKRAHSMGFLRQKKDGTTSLKILLKDDNEGPEKVVTIGELVGKLKQGTGQLQGLREDKRNSAKLVKPLNYGAFASFAPVFDSRFSNLTKEETDLVLRTYGDGSSSEYAESILQFTKDSNYATVLANGLLDVLTNGEHSKAMTELYEMQCQNHEQTEIGKCFMKAAETNEQIEQEYEKYKNTKIDFNRLRSLNDLGIDVTFLDDLESEMKNFELTRRLQEHLTNNLTLIEKLRVTQHERLSQPLPSHLALVPLPNVEETLLAQQITQHLSDLAKKLPPAAIANPHCLRKAMGMSNVGLSPPPQPRIVVPAILQESCRQMLTEENIITISDNDDNNTSNSAIPMDITEDVSNSNAANTSVDLESELREFLESGTELTGPAADDNNIVAQLLMN